MGISEILRLIGKDESFHHATYIELLRLSARYFPTDVYDALIQTQKGFSMPFYGIIAGSEQTSERLYPRREGVSVQLNAFTKVDQQIGLGDRRALVSIQNQLKQNSEPDEVQIFSVKRDGSMVIAEAYDEITQALRIA